MSSARVAVVAVASLVAAAACKGKGKEAQATEGSATGSSSAPGDAAVAELDWPTCEAALKANPTLPPGKRAVALIDGCRPCGDWTPILDWQRSVAEGGPTFKVLEAAMIGCAAFCDPTGKQRFLSNVDDARARRARTPWRELGEYCKGEVSALPDSRYMSGPYFALDRIARAVGKRPGGAALLAAIEIPLPAVSLTGVGLSLPDAPLTRPELIASHLTITVRDVSTGPLPIARLGADGVTVAGAPYPGTTTTLAELATALGPPAGRIAVFAPSALPATRLAEVVAAARTYPLVLASTTRAGPPGWTTYGVVPVTLTGTPSAASITLELGATHDAAIAALKAAPQEALRAAPVVVALDPGATVSGLATVLGALAFVEAPSVALRVAAPRRAPSPKR